MCLRVGGGEEDLSGRGRRGGEATLVCLGGSACVTAVLTGSGERDLERLSLTAAG